MMRHKYIPHLHCHSEYSILKGYGSIEKWYAMANETGIPALAFTEYGSMGSALESYLESKKDGVNVKNVFGMQAMYTMEVGGDINEQPITLLAQNKTGYQNLLKLSKLSWTDGWNGKRQRPFVDLQMLQENNEGIYMLTGSLSGPIAISSAAGYQIAVRIFEHFYNVFRDRLRIEIQLNEYDEQQSYNQMLIRLSDKYKVPMVLTNDCHFPSEHEYELASIIRQIDQMRNRPMYPRHMRLSKQGWLKSVFELDDYRRKHHGYITSHMFDSMVSNTHDVADSCDVDLVVGKHFTPHFDVTTHDLYKPDMTSRELFISIVNDGFKNKISSNPKKRKRLKEYKERVVYEVGLIGHAKFIDYFLIVEDIIRWARGNGVPVGAARGSCAGSLTAYCCGITSVVDPIIYDLLFERFLNPERILSSFPDIDIDIGRVGRPRVKQYITDRYGKDNVCTIGTYQTMKIKGLMRDLHRVFDGLIPISSDKKVELPFFELNRICNELEKLKVDKIETARAESDAFDKFCKVHSYFIDNYIRPLHGQIRDVSQHAAGVIIAPSPIVEWLPIRTQKLKDDSTGDERAVVSQWRDSDCEKIGLLKLDILGIKTLDACEYAEQMIEKRHDKRVSIEQIDMYDKQVLEAFNDGDTAGVFQYNSFLQSKFMQRFRLKFHQNKPVEDLIIINAILRPGPMDVGAHNLFSDMRNGLKEPEYDHELLRPLLENTLSLMIFQEQVMTAAHVLGGLTLGETDSLRSAMKHKDKDEMNAFGGQFVQGAMKHGMPEEKAKKVWEKLLSFFGYGFNRCLRGDSLITLANGEKRTIKGLYQMHRAGREIWLRSYDLENRCFVDNKVEEVTPSGKQYVGRLSLHNGRYLWATAKHGIATRDRGFRMFSDLTSEDVILCLPHRCRKLDGAAIDTEKTFFDDVHKENTYDITMAGEPRNYMANNILVHNSHSAAYAVFGYYCQWLKVHYPAEYWTGMLQFAAEDVKKSENIWTFREAAIRDGFKFLKPSVTRHSPDFYLTKSGKISWPIRAIKGIGLKAGQHIADTCQEYEPKTMEEFCSVVRKATINKSVMTKLIAAGAFYKYGNQREVAEQYWTIRNRSLSAKKQESLPEIFDHHHTETRYWDELRFEYLGFLDNPIRLSYGHLFYRNVLPYDKFEEKPDGTGVVLVGRVKTGTIRKMNTRNGPILGFHMFDSDGSVRVKLMYDYLRKIDEMPEEGDIVQVVGRKTIHEKYGTEVTLWNTESGELKIFR